MTKITYEQLRAMVMDVTVSEKTIATYLTSETGGTAFHPIIRPDPLKVEISEGAQFEIASALDWANGFCRGRRERIFKSRVDTARKPILVSEGDSWFQFPFLLEDVIDQLAPDYVISSLDAAGDTARNMVYGSKEYMPELLRLKGKNVKAFLFSAAGNDVIGSDEYGRSVLLQLLNDYSQGKPASWHIDWSKLRKVLQTLEEAYREVVSTIRRDRDFAKLPIIIHGYDYAIPGGFPGDKRNPTWAKKDQWLGAPMKGKKIVDHALQCEIIEILINELYEMLKRVAGDSSSSYVFLADIRKKVPPNEWADEIHPTDRGFAEVAKVFRQTLKKAGVR
ncbi:hypothetical protein M0412_04275 [Agrobacterium sp. O3.4]|jgi:hypothetical protein|uniref:SGNH hydrolase-type esterase domain-containing protein n=1 Tax=Agrobacterium cucumeris TaxID=2862866 RepID=A0ABY8RR45_9HYPH|nr:MULTISPECIES: hypothetical protein [Rhizobium/Agrobacterium group]MCZ7469726.1 hypothetical protein [Rhizobium rhizogenes]WHO09529.1 hypothetical protein KZ699_07075 [Agrobacterium cucumeris]